MDEQQPGFSKAVLAAVDSGRKIEAIKLYRMETGVGLKDAKDVIDVLFTKRQNDPQIATRMPEEGGAGGLVKMIVWIAVILGIYFYFFAR